MAPFPPAADVETSSEGYAARFSGPAGAWMLKVQEEGIHTLMGDDPGRILDVGGGHGQLAFPFCESGYDVTVLGSDPVCEELIRPLTRENRCRFVCGNVLKLPFEDEAFDTVVCVRLVCHCEEWPQLLSECCRVAARRVIVDYPTGRSLNALTGLMFGVKKKLEGNTRPYTLFNQAPLLEIVESCGFQLSGSIKQFFWPMVVHRKLGRPGISRPLEAAASATGLTRLLGSPVLLAVERAGNQSV